MTDWKAKAMSIVFSERRMRLNGLTYNRSQDDAALEDEIAAVLEEAAAAEREAIAAFIEVWHNFDLSRAYPVDHSIYWRDKRMAADIRARAKGGGQWLILRTDIARGRRRKQKGRLSKPQPAK